MLKRSKAFLLLVWLAGGVLFGQGQTTSSSAPTRTSRAYVRRLSAGATLSVLALGTMKDGTDFSSNADGTLVKEYGTTAYAPRMGYGVVVQAAITERFAISSSFLLRKIGFTMDTITTQGVTTITSTKTHEDTRARLYDVPLMVRYYFKDRHEAGPRFFVEGGGAVRYMSQVRTSVDTTDNNGVNTCCTSTSAVPPNKTVRGFVGGAGMQFVDDVGIRVVPEVRYTRWMAESWDAYSTHTQRNQIEAIISLTF